MMASKLNAGVVTVSIDAYISEMSVSNMHGGGLTLQRVLGSDIDHIKSFVHLDRFALDCPPVARVASKVNQMFTWSEKTFVQKFLGKTTSHRLSRHQAVQRAFARSAARRIAAGMSRERASKLLICPQGLRSLLVTERLREIRPLKYVTWIMDDHCISWVNGHWQYPPGVEAMMKSHLENASKVFTISPALSEFYGQRFGVDSEVLFGPSDFKAGKVRAGAAGESLRLSYFGAVTSWQLDALALLIPHLAASGGSLDIYSGVETLPEELTCECVRLKARIPPEHINDTMRDYDAVVLPISFLPELRNMSEFNIATKMSECIASGTVTVVIGPPDSAMVCFLKETGTACLLTDDKLLDWPQTESCLRDSRERFLLLQTAQKFAETNLSTRTMRDRWRRGLQQLDE